MALAEKNFADEAGHLINAVTGTQTSISNDIEEVQELETIGRNATSVSVFMDLRIATMGYGLHGSNESFKAILKIVVDWRNVH